jgi:uncharacterized protein YecE (DUF72 family)
MGAEGGSYSGRQLEEWARRISGFTAAGADVYAYFNNDWMGYAIKDAQRLRQMLQS